MRRARREKAAPFFAARRQHLRAPALGAVEPEDDPDVAKRRQVLERVLEVAARKELDAAVRALRHARLPRRLHLLRER